MKHLFALLAFLAGTSVALAAGEHDHSHGDGIGEPGHGHVDRTIEVELGEMFFSPDAITVASGETIRFVITNAGEFVHEFNIATAEMHEAHEGEMMHMMDMGILEADRINHHMMSEAEMNHDDPNSVLLEPGQSTELVWTFNGDAEIELSCNVPGHRGSGMVAPIKMHGEH